jgi:hypothetical protein
MKKQERNGFLFGYTFGDNICVHRNVWDSHHWYLTINPLDITVEHLCPIDCSEQEIARYVMVKIAEKKVVIDALMDEVVPFTGGSQE